MHTKNRQGNIGMVVMGTAAFMFLGVMYVWSVLRIELIGRFPSYTAAQMSLCFTLKTILFCCGGFFGGKLTERKSPAFSLRMSALLLLVGYGAASLMEFLPSGAALVFLYVFYACIAGFGTGVGYNACMGNVSPWFPGHIGLVGGILLMGFGASSLIFAVIIDWICPIVGIFNVFRLFAVSVFSVVFAASFFIKKPPAAENPRNKKELFSGVSLTPKQMISKRSFWIYFLWNTMSSAAGLLVINSAANIAVYFGVAASIGLVVSAFNGCGRPLVGALVDKVGQIRGMITMNLMLILASGLLIIADKLCSSVLMVFGLILVGVIYGGGGTINQKVICEMYGPVHFGVNHSISNFCVVISALAGPLLSGVLQDKSGGAFTSNFILLLIIGVIELLLLFALIATMIKEKIK